MSETTLFVGFLALVALASIPGLREWLAVRRASRDARRFLKHVTKRKSGPDTQEGEG